MKEVNYNKRQDSAKKYLDSLFDNYSKLSVVRVDLAYKKLIQNSSKFGSVRNSVSV